MVDLLQDQINTGEFFRYFKKFFKITSYIQLTYKDTDSVFEDIICLYVPLNKKYYLFFYGFEKNGNDSSGTIKIFNNEPKYDEIYKIIKLSSVFRYSDIFKKSTRIFKRYTHFKHNKKLYSEGYKLEHKTNPHFLNEEDYFNYHNTKGDYSIASSFALSNPEKYFHRYFKSRKNVSSYLSLSSGKIKEKIGSNRFFNFVMSDKLNYRSNIKFIEKIIYSYDDLEGFLEYVPKNIQESKSLKEEIRILRLFRSNDKRFIIKVFRTNKDKLDDLIKSYMPSTIFNDPYLMNELINLDINCTADIGKKLKRNKNFMSKVKKLLDNK